MKKYYSIISLVTFTVLSYQPALAHNENSGYEKRQAEKHAERQIKERQEDKQTWDDFMKQVNKQDAKKTADKSDHEHH